MAEPAFTDPRVLAVRDKIELVAEDHRATFNGASMTVTFTDGSSEKLTIENFLGTPGNPMSDEQLSAIFRTSAADHMPKQRIEDLLKAIWSLEKAPDIREMMSLARTGA
jgi:2-methylcitrate dehydratase PrpD